MLFNIKAFDEDSKPLYAITRANVILTDGHRQSATARLGQEIVLQIETWDDNPVSIDQQCIRIDGRVKDYGGNDLGDGYWLLSAVKE